MIQPSADASSERTTAVVPDTARRDTQVGGLINAVNIPGSDGATPTETSNGGVAFLMLESSARRTASGRSASVILSDVLKSTRPVDEATVIAIPPPPVRGVGNGGSLKMQVQSWQSVDVARPPEAAGCPRPASRSAKSGAIPIERGPVGVADRGRMTGSREALRYASRAASSITARQHVMRSGAASMTTSGSWTGDSCW